MFSNSLESKFRGMFNKAKAQKTKELEESVTRLHSQREQKVENAAENHGSGDNVIPSNSCIPIPCNLAQRRSLQSKFNKAKAQAVEKVVESVTRSGSQREQNFKADELYAIAKRRIVRQWPRDPNGPIIITTPPGKTAGNGQPLWGATVLDFYWVHRSPKMIHGLTITTGSKLVAHCKEIGELEYAKDEIAWASEEAEPEQFFPYSMSDLMKTLDYRPPESNEATSKLPSGIVSPKTYPKLETRIPLYLLPQKLIVHDPDTTLRVGSRGPKSGPTTRVYKLKLTPEATLEAKQERKKLLAEHKSLPREGKTYLTPSDDIFTGKTTSGPVIEPTFAEYPEAPPPLVSTPEAHLYLNRAERMGTGNHSHVYRATLEVPRELFEAPYVCDVCFEKALINVLREEVPDAPINESESLGHQIEALLIAAAAKHGRTGMMEIIKIEGPATQLDVDGHFTGTVEFGEQPFYAEQKYIGTRRTVPVPGVKWTLPGKYCEHEEERLRAGPMFKVHVAAKLSIKGDTHLDNEAVNYQSFPGHFFEHWSGYNVVQPIHDPTPALALVPQFYGYYVPVDEEESLAKDEDDTDSRGTSDMNTDTDSRGASGRDGGIQKGYLSPIMLLEDCGTPIDVDSLNVDDRQECAALLFRMHCGGWLHNSFFPRNVVMSYGDITECPADRKKEDRRFRLIDFGRSVKGGGINRAAEEWQCQEMFGILNCSL